MKTSFRAIVLVLIATISCFVITGCDAPWDKGIQAAQAAADAAALSAANAQATADLAVERIVWISAVLALAVALVAVVLYRHDPAGVKKAAGIPEKKAKTKPDDTEVVEAEVVKSQK
jgi:hypothetical protein